MILRRTTILFLLTCANLSIVSTSASATLLPVELKSAKPGLTKTVTVTVPAGKGAGVRRLWLRIHNCAYNDMVSVRVGSAAWTVLSNTTATVLGNGKVYGRIGGAFGTLDLTIPQETVPDGKVSVTFRFNGTNGVSVGYEVLGVNFLDAGGNRIVPQTQFQWDDPAKWKPPLASATDIAAGLKLWHEAPLTESPLIKTPIKVTCGDCHERDGRDLKYFCYSNTSIIQRSMFHGLTNTQGKQIASYIRTLSSPSPGRPWNPPYQPGPGLDAKPLSSWAAGAGLEWVLASDTDTFHYVFPSGITKDAIQSSGSLNVRETPVAMQLPDWNHWLPRRHPYDSWGQSWLDSEVVPRYEGLRTKFSDTANLPAYLQSAQSKTDINTWQLRRYEFLYPRISDPLLVWTNGYAEQVYGTVQWQGVKMWEMQQAFSLGEYGRDYFGPLAEKRTWLGAISYKTAPSQLGPIPNDATVAIGGSALVQQWLTNAWYYVQLVLNPGNGVAEGTTPIDWGYTFGRFFDVFDLTRSPELPGGAGEMGRFTVYYVKCTQECNGNGLARDTGWNVDTKVKVDWAVGPAPVKMWLMVDPTTRAQVMTAWLGAWLDKSLPFASTAYYAELYTTPTTVPSTGSDGYKGTWSDRVYYMIGGYKSQGVPAATLDRISLLGKSLMPTASWPRAVFDGSE